MHKELQQLTGKMHLHKKDMCTIFELLWCVLFAVLKCLAPLALAMIGAPVGAIIFCLLIAPYVSKLYSWLNSKGFRNGSMHDLVFYSFSYLLTLILTIELSESIVKLFNINEVECLKFLLKAIAFILYIGVLYIYRNPNQLQYHFYAITYGLSLLLEWAVDIEVLKSLIDTHFVLEYFVIPFKEAMLLFIILDTYLIKKDQMKKENTDSYTTKPRSSQGRRKRKKQSRKGAAK